MTDDRVPGHFHEPGPTPLTPSPTPIWGVLVQDNELRENRLVGMYYDAAHANADAVALQVDGAFTDVVPMQIHRAPQWSAFKEPAWERTDDDFDVPVDPA